MNIYSVNMSKDRDGRPSQAQMKKLLDLLSVDGILKDGKVNYEDTNHLKFWKRMAVQLNSVENGTVKKFHKWCKTWADWKAKTKKKADISRRTFGAQKPNFTKLELRLLKLINYPIHELTLSVSNENMTYNQIHKNTNKLNEDFDPMESDDDSTGGFNEDNREFVSLGVQDSHIMGILDNEEMMSEEAVNIKVEAKDSNNSKVIEDSKAKMRLPKEKERIHQKTEELRHQKTEELRLKAIELKLKADELKLQETEVNRVSYLTQLEEQKLKCMTEIAASLKELVEWTRNGSTRFHNVM